MNMSFGGSSWDGLMGKVIMVGVVMLSVAIIWGIGAISSANLNVANACAFINGVPGYVCLAGADEANVFFRDGSRTATGDWNINGNDVNGAASFGVSNGGTVRNAGGTAIITLGVGAANVTTGALQVGGVPVLTETGTQTMQNKTVSGPLTFADATANPDANGELQRNGSNLLYYDGTNARSFLHQLTASGQCQGYVAANGADADLKAAVTEARNNYGNLYAVADGTSDNVEIQAAVDALAGAAGTICLSLGSFSANGAVTLADGQRIRGAGQGGFEVGEPEGTRYNYSGTAANDVFTIGTSGSRIWNAGLSDMMVRGASSTGVVARVAGGLNVIQNVTFENVSTDASSVTVLEEGDSAQNIIRENWFSNGVSAKQVWINSRGDAGTIVEDNFFWDNNTSPVVIGAAGVTGAEAPANIYVANNVFEANTASILVDAQWCEGCVYERNTFAAGGADLAATVGLSLGPSSGSYNFKTITVRNNDFRCRDVWNRGVVFTAGAEFDALIHEGNIYDRCVQYGMDNTLVTPTTTNTGWIYDGGNNANTVQTSDGAIEGASALYAVDGVAGGVIAPYAREAAISELFTASASGSEAWAIIPRSSATTSTGDAGLNGSGVTWRANTTTTSLQAWATPPQTLGNGVSPVFDTVTLNNGTTSDSDFFSLTSAGADVAGTWLGLVRIHTDNASSKSILTKYNDQADHFEWAFDISGTETVRITLYDDSAGATGNVWIGRTSTATLTVGQWYLLMATYDGSATSAGLKLYSYSLTSASQIDTTDNNQGVYASMDNTAATVITGGYTGSAGSVAGVCPCNIGYVGFIPGVEMTRAEGLQAAYALMPYVGAQLGR